ncbi:MAG: 3-methyl-2-oxobutanoate dehydrogenase subunit VorB [Candidatus Omnitrophica bacterium]|nr:3-methyl-2-oxobutanoate dehydrogenase subunit VorB [Candidatus Omnitrophota bacterium]
MTRPTTIERKLTTGNEAIAEGAIQAGCRFYAGYPITPQNELCEYMARHMPEVGGTFIQSESEIAAINMVFGAAVAGARAMTSSSSPGISLKQEGISYIAACELPAVISNMMRGGPGLGNVWPAQSDYFQATKGGGHGDYHLIVLAPATVQEAFDMTKEAFDLADRYRNPVMILGDGILGQMMESFEMKPAKTRQPSRKKDYILDGCKGRKPRVIQSLFLEEGMLERLNDKLQAKYRRIERELVRYEELNTNDADLILVAYGSSSRIARAVMRDARVKGLKIGFFRPMTLWPFPTEAMRKLAKPKRAFLVIEMSAGQMVEDVRLSIEGRAPVYFYGRSGGGIPSEEAVFAEVRKALKKARSKVK